MKKILISPFSRKLRNGQENPKNYPYWEDLIYLLKKEDFYIIQIGSGDEKKIINVDEFKFDLNFNDLKNEILNCFFWISVDNCINHLGSFLNKKGFVIWGMSDPNIFGYKSNINLLKNREFLRKNQFEIWENERFNETVFMSPIDIIYHIKNNI